MSYPNFVWGQLFVNMLIFADQVELFNINRYTIRMVSRCYRKK